MAESLVGKLLADRFRLRDLLGEGSVGEVYLAEHEVLQRKHAIKVLKEQFQTDPRLMERFRREALAASRLEHPHIVYISDFGRAEDGRLYLAMEYVEGARLDELVNQASPGVLPLRRCLRLLDQMADALAAAHDAGIVHRDFKPENVMVELKGHSGEMVKILDFGLAMIMVDTDLFKVTRKGEIFGTPTFMSPEQARGEPLDSRTDIYSFGAVAFEMFTGRPPFEGNSVQDLIIANQMEIPPAPADVRPADAPPLPAELGEMVLACLAKDKDQRPQRMTDLRRVMERCRSRLRRPTRSYGAATRALPSVAPAFTPAPADPPPVVGSAQVADTAPDLRETMGAPPAEDNRALAARVAVKDPWLWRQVVRLARTLAARLQGGELPTDSNQWLTDLARSDGELQTLERELAFPAARLAELEQSHRERTAQLRHAVIDLSLERDQVSDAPQPDPAKVTDLEFQIRTLEERLAEEYQTGKTQSAGLAREVAAMEGRRDELQQERIGTEIKVLVAVLNCRHLPTAQAMGPDYGELDDLLRG